ncbi:MAG: GH3 auxin-responsive promoter family protein [Planctomycetaceae bacterium]
MNSAWWLNTLWMERCRGEARAFRRATAAVAATQARVLNAILRRNRETEFGRHHGFAAIRGPDEYRQRVPLSNHDDYVPDISQIADGERNVLTRDPVRLLEPTSGSTSGEKLIPYTASLRREFQRGVAAWVFDLMRHRPAVRAGRAYWSISPALGQSRRTPGGIPIGFDSDAAYLGRLERLAVERLLVVPAAVSRIGDIESFRYATLLHLLAAADLALISVWSPTFLTALFASLDEWGERLADDLRRGMLRPPTASALPSIDVRPPRISARRAERVASILRSADSVDVKLHAIWPDLSLISCWTDAAAAGYVGGLRKLFPSVEIQPKGLLATEGCVSLPMLGRPAPLLAVRSHFFEFEECAAAGEAIDGGSVRQAHELQAGSRYSVVLTTGGGLYRYRLHDLVEVIGFENECPLLRFVGRSSGTSDLVGEKLSEIHVREVLDRVFAARGLTPGFALLVPILERPPRYRLYLQCDAAQVPSFAAEELAAAVQTGLEENPHYGHAVRLRQLGRCEVHMLDPAGESAWRIHECRLLERGRKAGDIKPAALDPNDDWASVFAPLVIDPRHSE